MTQSDLPRHELKQILLQDLNEIGAEYERIYARATEDPGTAGDEAESNWAGLLQNWLPASYTVVTKGRILGADGTASRQLDVLVLRAAYPPRLVDKKLYLADGVAAAFECKTTLKRSHLNKAAETAAEVRGLVTRREGTPYRELVSPLLYGVLAHSHSWKSPGSTPREHVEDALSAAASAASHPHDLIDVVCVADLGCWTTGRMPYYGPHIMGDIWPTVRAKYGLPGEGVVQAYVSSGAGDASAERPNPIAALVADVTRRLAWEDPAVRPIADYYRLAALEGPTSGRGHPFSLDIYSDLVRDSLLGGRRDAGWWNEWGPHF